MIRRAVLAALVAGLLAAPGAAAAELELSVSAARTGAVLASQTVRLEPGAETRMVRHGLTPGPGGTPVDLVLGVSLREEGPAHVVVELHAIVRAPGAGTPLAWTSRTFTIGTGEEASFVVEPPGASELAVAARFGGPDVDGAEELRSVRMRALVRVRAVTPGGERILEERRLRLTGAAPTEVVLESPGRDGGAALVLRLRPRARDDDGAVLELAVARRLPRAPARVLREDQVRLGWNDVVTIDAIHGPDGPIRIDLLPGR